MGWGFWKYQSEISLPIMGTYGKGIQERVCHSQSQLGQVG